MPEDLRSQVARLVQIHFDTHPERIARRFGLSASYVRQLWRERNANELADAREAMAALQASGPSKAA